MSSFRLNINFTMEQLQQIKASKKEVVLSKINKGQLHPSLVWLSFSPMLNNKIDWDENYHIYASNSSLKTGTVLNKCSVTTKAALENHTYILGPNCTISEPTKEGAGSGYKVIHQDQQTRVMVVGLTQDINFNGTANEASIVLATPMTYNSHVLFNPDIKIYIGVREKVASGMVISPEDNPNPLTEVHFSLDKRTLTVDYNSDTLQFDVQ